MHINDLGNIYEKYPGELCKSPIICTENL